MNVISATVDTDLDWEETVSTCFNFSKERLHKENLNVKSIGLQKQLFLSSINLHIIASVN